MLLVNPLGSGEQVQKELVAQAAAAFEKATSPQERDQVQTMLRSLLDGSSGGEFGGGGTQEASAAAVHSSTPSYVDTVSETSLERTMDVCLGLAFLVTALVALRRMLATTARPAGSNTSGGSSRTSGVSGGAAATSSSSSGGGSSDAAGAETTVVTAFYSLILLCSFLRAIWFLIPATVWQPSYTPSAVYAWDGEHPAWVGMALSELCVTSGSLSLFSIFILILVYWADILKKYFHPGSRRSLPMRTFLTLVAALAVLMLLNLILFFCRLYTTEGMILAHALLLAAVSIVCVVEITIFSHRFRTVLKTLGAINQVSTDSQVRRIVWITVTGNLFFLTRALLETVFAVLLLAYWRQHGTVDRVFSHAWWDTYTAIKYVSEVTILALMLYILQSRFRAPAAAAANTAAANAAASNGRGAGAGYSRVPDAQVV